MKEVMQNTPEVNDSDSPGYVVKPGDVKDLRIKGVKYFTHSADEETDDESLNLVPIK